MGSFYSIVQSSVEKKGTNPYTGRPYSQRYYDILEKRKTLPIYEHKQEFIDLVTKNQIVILVGETGSGKLKSSIITHSALHSHN